MNRTIGSLARLVLPRKQSDRRVIQDTLLTLGMLGLASVVCWGLVSFSVSESTIPLVYVLAVLVVARFTDGALYSLFASVVSVIGVNYAFTYPYFEVNFTLTGYPLTFFTMLAVSMVVGMLTEQVKRQGEIQAEAEAAKLKANLLRSVSHDLRTPLTSIIGASDAVLDNYDQFTDEVKRDLITHVRDDAQWLMRLVENILSITRMNNGAVRLRKELEAAEEIAAEAVTKFRKHLPATHAIAIRVRVPEELLLVPMDATLIEQVIINLMENAVQHGGQVREIGLSVSHEGNSAVFSVTDDGQGIASEMLPKLFHEGFPHAGELRGDGRRNMGIGLSVCKSIVEAHGGSMRVENKPDRGACVSFALPMEEE